MFQGERALEGRSSPPRRGPTVALPGARRILGVAGVPGVAPRATDGRPSGAASDRSRLDLGEEKDVGHAWRSAWECRPGRSASSAERRGRAGRRRGASKTATVFPSNRRKHRDFGRLFCLPLPLGEGRGEGRGTPIGPRNWPLRSQPDVRRPSPRPSPRGRGETDRPVETKEIGDDRPRPGDSRAPRGTLQSSRAGSSGRWALPPGSNKFEGWACFMRLDFAGGRGLLLAGSGQGWLWLVAGLAALALLLLLYREERRLVSRRAGLGLLGLRLLAASGPGARPVRADRLQGLARVRPGPGARRRRRLGEHDDRRPQPPARRAEGAGDQPRRPGRGADPPRHRPEADRRPRIAPGQALDRPRRPLDPLRPRRLARGPPARPRRGPPQAPPDRRPRPVHHRLGPAPWPRP